MACVAGEREQYSRRFYPSPSSSPENAPFPITMAQSPPSRVVESTSSPAKHQLHTPAPSIDSTPAPPSARDASLSAISKLVNEILAAKTSDTGFLELHVSREVWPDLFENVPEDLGAKLQYSFDTQMLLVTWPTKVHESFKWITKSLLEATKARSQFVWETNTPIPFTSGPHKGGAITPDFAFGKDTSNDDTLYSIIVESAFTQSPKKLEEAAAKHLTRPEVACVIGLNFDTPSFTYPSPSPTPVPDLSFDGFKAGAKGSLRDGIEFRGTTWAPPIKGIQLTIWFKKQGTVAMADKMTWDITPTEDDTRHLNLRKRHSEILNLIRKISCAVIEKSTFKLIYPDKDSFNIDWRVSHACVPNEPAVEINNLGASDVKKRAYDLYGSDSEAEDGDAGTDGNVGKVSPPNKKVKTSP
ncbi:hypothetical protein K438DRAFT_1888925, partial [Mycena galopus ATCC 62051]